MTREDFSQSEASKIYEKWDKLPPVNPQEPKTGHWLYSGENGRDKWTCDNCFDFVRKPQKICPNCGARMESEVT